MSEERKIYTNEEIRNDEFVKTAEAMSEKLKTFADDKDNNFIFTFTKEFNSKTINGAAVGGDPAEISHMIFSIMERDTMFSAIVMAAVSVFKKKQERKRSLFSNLRDDVVKTAEAIIETLPEKEREEARKNLEAIIKGED